MLERSREKALAVYEKEAFEPGAYRRLMLRLGLKPPAGAGGYHHALGRCRGGPTGVGPQGEAMMNGAALCRRVRVL